LRRAGLEVVGYHVLHQAQGAAAHFCTGLQVDHERATHLHRREAGVHTVGQAAFLAHFAHQAGAETTAAEDLVAQGQGCVVRVGAVDAQLGEQQMCLFGRELDVAQAGLGLGGLGDLRQGRALGQRGGHLGGHGFGFGAGQVAHYRNHRIAGGISFGVKGLQLRQGDVRHAFWRAFTGMGIRMIAI